MGKQIREGMLVCILVLARAHTTTKCTYQLIQRGDRLRIRKKQTSVRILYLLRRRPEPPEPELSVNYSGRCGGALRELSYSLV